MTSFASAGLLDLGRRDDSVFKLDVGVRTEIHGFSFDTEKSETPSENDNSDSKDTSTYNFSGRQKILKYDFELVQTVNAEIKATFLGNIHLSAEYGNDAISFTKKNDIDSSASAINKVVSKKTELYGISAGFMGVEFRYENFQFNAGKVEVIDVSHDPKGEVGTVTETFGIGLLFKTTEAKIRLGEMIDGINIDWSFRNANWYWVIQYLNLSWLNAEIEAPIIPYSFRVTSTRTGDNTHHQYAYESEGDLQLMKSKSSKFGMGWDSPYIELMMYGGNNKMTATNSAGTLTELKTYSMFYKIRLSYFKEIYYSWCTLVPGIDLNYFSYAISEESSKPTKDSDGGTTTLNEHLTTFGGDFTVYKGVLYLKMLF